MKWKARSKKSVFGFTYSQFESSVKQRKVERPDYETLKKQINEYGFVGTGKLFGVSDNSIRKWLKFYEKTEVSN